ncbi:MAG TPA: hypothetical protein VN976_12370 [Verrucomicrobiae bacterium]|nr:hypothetical protein [Verrucomicrobiae bacterium]
MHGLAKDLYLIVLIATFAIIMWDVLSMFSRWDRKRVAALLDLFDTGTAVVNGASVGGFFQGRPARVSSRHGPDDFIRVCVSGYFFMPFEVRTKRARKIYAIRNGLKLLRVSLSQLFFLLSFGYLFVPMAPPWKFAAAVFLFIFTLILLIACYGKWMGYFEGSEAPKGSKWEVPLPGSAPLLYITYLPSRARPVIDRPEFQESVAHVIGACRVDLLRSPGDTGYPWRFHGWNGSIEAECNYRRNLLQPDAVRETLIELAALCERIEQIAQANEQMEPTAPRPL